MRSAESFLRRLGGIACACLIAWFGAGCASSDLSSKGDVAGQVAESLPVGTPAAAAIARAIWYPHASGFTTTDASPIGNATGVLALAGDKLWFLEWNDDVRAFDVMRTIPVPSVVKIRVAHLGSQEMLVVESDNMAFDSFELMNGSRFGSDTQTMEDLVKKIQRLQADQGPREP